MAVTSRFIYQYCESVREKPNGELQFETRSWCPVDLALQEIARSLVDEVSLVQSSKDQLPMKLHHLVGGTTSPGYTLLRFH